MDFSSLLKQLDNFSEENRKTFCNTNKNDKKAKDISGILYFNEEEYQNNPNFLEKNDTESLYTIKTDLNEKKNEIKEEYKNFSYYVKIHTDINNYNLSFSYQNITECLLNVLKYQNYNAKNIFFKKLLREFDVYKLFKKYNYKRQFKKSELRNSLINKEDNNDMIRQFLSDYLNINLIILTNTKINTYCKDNQYEIFRPTIIIYEHENKFSYISDKIEDKNIFTSEDNINLKLAKYFLSNEVIKSFEEKNKQTIMETLKKKEEEEKSRPKLVDFKKLKVTELRSLCLQYHIPIQEMGKNGKMKNIVKKELIEKLEMVLK